VTEHADQSGLLYRRNRYYDPKSGQFTQKDPIGIAGGMNLYGFADGDPVNFSDPFGLTPVAVCAIPVVTPACAAGASALITGAKLAIGAALGGALGYAGHARAVGRTQTALDVARKHIDAASGPPPGGGEDPNWEEDKLKQAQKHINNARKYVKDALGKTRRQLERDIDNAQRALDSTRQPSTGAAQ
jgi:RHS repeat-associated protein